MEIQQELFYQLKLVGMYNIARTNTYMTTLSFMENASYDFVTSIKFWNTEIIVLEIRAPKTGCKIEERH